MCRSQLVFAAILLAASSASADQVHLAEGRVLEGTATVLGDKVVVELESGSITVPLREVSKIDRAQTPLAEATKREAALKPHDLEGLLQLASYCRDHDLLNKERELLSRVLALAPDHAEARRRLGFVRMTVEGRAQWVDRAELTRREEASRQASRLERKQAQLTLEQKEAELQLAHTKLERERALRQREQNEREAESDKDTRYALRPQGWMAPSVIYGGGVGYGYGGGVGYGGNVGHGGGPFRYGYGVPALSPPSGPPPFSIPGVRHPSDTSFAIPGVRPPAAYFEGAFRR